MKFIADLHVHSKFSRATAKNLDLEHLYIAAQLKGITVVGTGDFTYPGWFSEIKEKLVPAEPGLFKLTKELQKACDQQVPSSCRQPVRFILATEISNIYKKNEKTRKNHNLVLAPDMQVAEQFSAKLDSIGNIKSDGRPILGLDARDLLETLLETSDQACLIPAHIWTPWFSMLGSKSGFNSVEECFEDLTPYIFAVETGLSSDPPMNWRVSALDGLTLVSNSDAHSPMNLGREANLFDTVLSYSAIMSALKTGDSDQFLGTFEFYPEEGKYHLDGHRNCQVRLWPRKTATHQGKCPQCGKALTLGVLYRVEELQDREDGQAPEKHPPYYNLIPLTDVLSEILRVGPKTKKVARAYNTAIEQLGCEFNILHRLDPEQIDTAGIALLGEAIRRMRQKEIEVIPGYDGEYGKVKIFSVDEHEKIIGQKSLFTMPQPHSSPENHNPGGKEPIFGAEVVQSKPPRFPKPPGFQPPPPRAEQQPLNYRADPVEILNQLNAQQRQAVEMPPGALMIVAGPGTGKTRTLTHRIAWYILQKKIDSGRILAVTFTNKAADEMRARLRVLLGDHSPLPFVATFHGFCLRVLNDCNPQHKITIIDDNDRKKLVSEALKRAQKKDKTISLKVQTALRRIIEAKQQILEPDDYIKSPGTAADVQIQQTAEIYRTYQQLLSIQKLHDYEDLIFRVVRLLESDKEARHTYRERYQHIFADEYQDLNQGQYRILRALVPPRSPGCDICIIGDPDQSIYGFRGSDSEYFNRFGRDYTHAEVIRLTRNYRSTKTILDASYQVVGARRDQSAEARTYSQINGVQTISTIEASNENSEAEAIARIIENLVGGTGFHSIDTGRIDDANLAQTCSYSDFAVLYRTHAQHRVIAEIFGKSGIPFQIASRETLLTPPGLADLIAYLKVVNGDAGYGDHETVMRLAVAGIGNKTLAVFKDWCYQNRFSSRHGLSKAKRFPVPGLSTSRQQMLTEFSDHLEALQTRMADLTVAEKLDFLVKNSILFSMFENDPRSKDAFKILTKWAAQFGRQTDDFITALALHTDTDAWAGRVEKVSLMTMHAAKGLEFPVVFISGCEQGYVPFQPPSEELREQDIGEERRLFYVAMTRAMERLYLTHAKKRRIYGQLESRHQSPFVADIATRLKRDEICGLKKKKKKTDQKQRSLF
jgi:uncharacterized protein (TIGR00375 family)